tara:strand:- start:28 stop:681 length:654 start_codon:yes stop_codon:yes gene_type:complete
MSIKCVFFDLDGTLADTSVDMCNALNTVLLNNKFKTVDCIKLKTHISKGALGMISYASTVNGRPIDSSLLRADFLQEYSENCFIHTEMVKNMMKLIDHINNNSIPWGIVTNKHSKFVTKIIKELELESKINCVVTGDMVSEPKPSPEGLIEASKLVNIQPTDCVYVGDDERDIIAGKAAGMLTVAADFGFINEDEDINTWQADMIIKDPIELIELIV